MKITMITIMNVLVQVIFQGIGLLENHVVMKLRVLKE